MRNTNAIVRRDAIPLCPLPAPIPIAADPGLALGPVDSQRLPVSVVSQPPSVSVGTRDLDLSQGVVLALALHQMVREKRSTLAEKSLQLRVSPPPGLLLSIKLISVDPDPGLTLAKDTLLVIPRVILRLANILATRRKL